MATIILLFLVQLIKLSTKEKVKITWLLNQINSKKKFNGQYINISKLIHVVLENNKDEIQNFFTKYVSVWSKKKILKTDLKSLGISLYYLLAPLNRHQFASSRYTSNYKQVTLAILKNIFPLVITFFSHSEKVVFAILSPPFKTFAPKSNGSDFPSCIFHPWSDSRNIWCLTYFHWIDLLHCFQVHQQLDFRGKASVMSCDDNFPSVITYFLS